MVKKNKLKCYASIFSLTTAISLSGCYVPFEKAYIIKDGHYYYTDSYLIDSIGKGFLFFHNTEYVGELCESTKFNPNNIVPQQMVALKSLVNESSLTEEDRSFIETESKERDQWLDKNIEYPITGTIGDEAKIDYSMHYYTCVNKVTEEENYYIGYDYTWRDPQSEELGLFDISTGSAYPLAFQEVQKEPVVSEKEAITKKEATELLETYKAEQTKQTVMIKKK